MANQLERNLALVRTGQVSSTLLTILEPLIQQQNAEIDRKMYTLMAGTAQLTADQALKAWMEKNAWNRVREALRKHMATGQSAATLVEGGPNGEA